MQTLSDNRFGGRMTPLTKRVLIALLALYGAQVLAATLFEFDSTAELAWWSLATDKFQPWQPLTAWLTNQPQHLPPLLTWLGVYFALPLMEQDYGKRGLLLPSVTLMATAGLITFLADGLGLLRTSAFYGLGPLTLAWFVLFGLNHGEAKINLYFMIPIQARWFAWAGTGLAALILLLERDLGASMGLGAVAGAWLWTLALGRQSRLRRWYLKRRHDRIHQDLRVIQGGREGPPAKGRGWRPKQDPTIH